MPDTFKTKIFSSTQAGSPVLNGVAGSLISLLDAVLVTGFGTTNVTSITVLNGIATVVFPASHAFAIDTVALVAGATPVLLNGEKRVLSRTSTGMTYATTAPNGVATGTITARVAPAGWEKLFTAANKACYRSLSPESTKMILRVDDTGTTSARVTGYESMTDVDTGTGLFPSIPQIAAPGLWWSKSSGADTSARKWDMYADHMGFYYFPQNSLSALKQGNYFGDILSNKSNDPYACVLRAFTGDASGSVNARTDELVYHDGGIVMGGLYMARASHSLGGSDRVFSCLTVISGVPINNFIGAIGFPFPSPVDNGLHLYRLQIHNPTHGVRGYFPGIQGSNQLVNAAFNDNDVVLGTGSMVGTKVLACGFGATVGRAMLFVSHTEDWRV